MHRFVLFALAAAPSIPFVLGHGYLTTPRIEFAVPATKTQPAFSMPPLVSHESVLYLKDSPSSPHHSLTKALVNHTLRQLIAPYGPSCGNSITTGTKQPVPASGIIVWSESFNHTGPCEAYVNGNVMLRHHDCASAYPQVPVHIHVDFSSCYGKAECPFQFIWLGGNATSWDVYSNCATLAWTDSHSPPPPTTTTRTPQAFACGAPRINMTIPGNNDLLNFSVADLALPIDQCQMACREHATCDAVTLAAGVCYLKRATHGSTQGPMTTTNCTFGNITGVNGTTPDTIVFPGTNATATNATSVINSTNMVTSGANATVNGSTDLVSYVCRRGP
ncbi:Aste57867_18416 [Aphanomyces stellatus]|uniref:Aste57867_18416 protein n=1 Tax=Aphanomyces stellatus TaxID=120398 RepID=A0A485LAD0_9STRA|nr:hypothetical protein As57867_018354 [Aphanomyces stellatus]VFT95152.1 Aste57867_18416 [Aphanomyces stellatus]